MCVLTLAKTNDQGQEKWSKNGQNLPNQSNNKNQQPEITGKHAVIW